MQIAELDWPHSEMGKQTTENLWGELEEVKRLADKLNEQINQEDVECDNTHDETTREKKTREMIDKNNVLRSEDEDECTEVYMLTEKYKEELKVDRETEDTSKEEGLKDYTKEESRSLDKYKEESMLEKRHKEESKLKCKFKEESKLENKYKEEYKMEDKYEEEYNLEVNFKEKPKLEDKCKEDDKLEDKFKEEYKKEDNLKEKLILEDNYKEDEEEDVWHLSEAGEMIALKSEDIFSWIEAERAHLERYRY